MHGTVDGIEIMRRNLLRRNLLSLLLPGLFSGLSALPLTAQVPGGVPARAGQDPTLVDKVIAVVGDSVILLGELEREHELAREQGVDMTEAEVLDNLINLQVILQTAARDSTLIPPAAEVNRRVDQHVESVRADFPDEAAFQQALAQEGMTLATYREQLRSQIRSDLIRTAFVQRRYQTAPPVVVSDAEMRAFFEEHRHSPELQQRPELLTVRQVIILAGASDAAWARAHHVADSLHALLLRGADFAELAREHSEDPGSAEEGGDLGWIARGELVPEFERAAFALIDGRVSPPVRTQFGYHVILAERSRPGEKRLRHILIRPEVEPGDIERSRALAEDVARRIREGEDALALARAHGDPDYPRELQVERGQEAQQLPPVFAQNLFGTQQGDVVGPFEANIRQRDYVVVLQVTQVREAGEFTFEDVRDVIREILSQQKREETMYRDLRERTYVELRF